MDNGSVPTHQEFPLATAAEELDTNFKYGQEMAFDIKCKFQPHKSL